jgi:tRNA A-37 threonylcarbamoyl transferase component Bud32
MRFSTLTDKDEDILGDLIQKWEELREMGQETPASELCHAHPHLVQELARRINILNVTSWLDEPLEPVTNDDPPAAAAPAASRTLAGRYRLDTLVAEGGFAQVWQGYDLELQRVVAVKVPKPSRLVSADAFMAEARRVARIKHPGVVQVFDVGRDGEHCFIVSEFVEGGSLGDHLVNNPPAPQQTIRWIADIADALEHAHLHGVIHRDVKPANILIDSHNRALLGDFGIAQSANRAGKQALSLGTLRYMAPEQLEGKDLDPRSDVFSLGVVLHEALTGKVPYSSLQPNVLRREIVTGVKQVVSPTMSDTIKQICEKALQRDPAKRQVSAAQFASELRAALTADGHANGSSGHKRWWWLGALVLLAGAAAFAMPWTKKVEPLPPVSQPIAGVFSFAGNYIETPVDRFAPVTLEAWIYPTSLPPSGCFVIGSDIRGHNGIGLALNGQQLAYEYLTGFEVSDSTVPLKKWTHVAAIFGETETRLYNNGKLVHTGPATRAEGGTPFVVGRIGATNPDLVFVGQMRCVRISKGERYKQDFMPDEAFTPDSSTVLIYDGRHVDGNRVLDLSSGGADGIWE